MIEQGWTMSPFKEKDLSQVAELGAAIYGKDSELADIGFLKWQLFKNPSGNPIMWIARCKNTNKLVGSYTVIPLRISIEKKELMGSLSLNTMTHPDFQRQGIFKALAEATFKTCKKNGMLFTIGLPNDASYHGFVRSLGFEVLGHNEMMVKFLNFESITSQFIKNKLVQKCASNSFKLMSAIYGRRFFWRTRSKVNKIQIREIVEFDEKFDSLGSKLNKTLGNSVVRNKEYLNWRFKGCPSRDYKVFGAFEQDKLKGYIIGTVSFHPKLKNSRIVYIVDAAVDDKFQNGETWTKLLFHIEDWACSEHIDCVATYLPRHIVCYSEFRKAGFFPLHSKLRGGAGAFIFRSHSDKINWKQVQLFTDWYIMPGDNDRP